MFRSIIPASMLGLAVLAVAFDPTPCPCARPAKRIEASQATLAPMAHAQFCLTYPDDCAFPQPPRNHDVALTTATRLELAAVNRQINRSITPKRDERSGGIEAWLLYPESGDCNDYAVTKRHELYARGWPAKALLLAEVELTSSGEHHLVLVARTREADLVLDNFRPSVRVWTDTLSDFKWLRMQSPDNPRSWSKVHGAGV